MSKRASITDEMILNAALDIARNDGAENINARSIANKIGCTTQPVLYHFSSIIEIKAEVYLMADNLLTEYISDISGRYSMPVLEFGMQYVKFADSESHLFRLLFQSEIFESKKLDDILNSEIMEPLIDFVADAAGVSSDKAFDLFTGIFLLTHGVAGMVANGAMDYDEKHIAGLLESIYEPILNNYRVYDNSGADGKKSKGKLNIRGLFEKE